MSTNVLFKKAQSSLGPQKASGSCGDSAFRGDWWEAPLTALNSCREGQDAATGRPTETA